MKVGNVVLVAMAAAVMGLSGCTTMLSQECNVHAAYEDGVNDGEISGNPAEMNPDYAAACLPSKRQAINASYAQGYQYGVKHPVHFKNN